MWKKTTLFLCLIQGSIAFSGIFSFKAKQVSPANQYASCSEKMQALAQKMESKVNIINYGCFVSDKNPIYLDGFVEYESEKSLHFFDSDYRNGSAYLGLYSTWNECSESMAYATKQFEELTGSRVDLAYCSDRGLLNDRTPYRFRLISLNVPGLRPVWIKKYLFGRVINFSKSAFEEMLKENLKSYGIDLFALGFRPNVSFSEILFGSFSSNLFSMKQWADLLYDDPYDCLENANEVNNVFSERKDKPALVFCSRKPVGGYRLHIWAVTGPQYRDLTFRIHPLQQVFGTITDCETNMHELGNETIGEFCAKDGKNRMRKHLILKAKRIEK